MEWKKFKILRAIFSEGERGGYKNEGREGNYNRIVEN